ncbi:MAG: SLC13 family permease [bacterium]
MAAEVESRQEPAPPKLLLVDDEDTFRAAMKKQLSVRGYQVTDVDNGADAVKAVRRESPEVVILDQKMPKMDGLQALREIKKLRPEVQVIMLTGHGSDDAARNARKLDVFHYMHKPCGMDEMIDWIEAARQERIYAMKRSRAPGARARSRSLKQRLVGRHEARPGVLLAGALILAALCLLPPAEGLVSLLAGGAGAGATPPLSTGLASEPAGLDPAEAGAGGAPTGPRSEPASAAARRAQVMIGVLAVSVLFWAAGALPVGVTALVAGALMYFLEVLPPERVAQAFVKDSVVFLFGLLALAAAMSASGLDRRIGFFLLRAGTSVPKHLLLSVPMVAVAASFLPGHVLIALLAPVLLVAYKAGFRTVGDCKGKSLAVALFLALAYAANLGGPGSPAAGGRNALLLGILSDHGVHVSFGQWVALGLPFVPAAAITVGLYFLLICRRALKARKLNVADEARKESRKMGPMSAAELRTTAVLAVLVLLWLTVSDRFGMGGPVILALVVLHFMGVLRWDQIRSIHWEIVAIYAAATAVGTGLAATGASLWMAQSFMKLLPDFMETGAGLCVAASLAAGLLSNLTGDGAAVAAVGPVAAPLAALSGTSAIAVGLAVAFASSFANLLVIATPGNAIVYSLARDPETGERMVTPRDFLVHGTAVLALNFAVLWGWAFFGYWKWLSP